MFSVCPLAQFVQSLPLVRVVPGEEMNFPVEAVLVPGEDLGLISRSACRAFRSAPGMEEAREGRVLAGGDRPSNVGILAAEVYFPSTFVSQVT